jgi:DNA (cytosine-5)-methyltransferase 1
VAKTRFIDLYAGIGGIRLGFQKAFKDESEFVFSNEIDQKASKTYSQNFNDDPLGDITKVNHSSINDFDILLAGFPCQAFSIAGKRKGLDDARGTHFFEVAKIIDKKRPTAFLLENVRHFRTHDSGKTFATLKRILTEDLNYTLYSGLLNAVDFGLPQNRNRFFMVGFKDPIHFEFPKPSGNVKTVGDILEKNVAGEYFLSQKYLDTLKRHRQRHEGKGNGFGYIVLKKSDIANTLVLGGMGRERNLIQDVVSLKKSGRMDANSEAIRCLTPRECLRLQGFPDSFKFTVPKTHLYRQAANSVAVPVIKQIALQMKKALEEKEPSRNLVSYLTH